MKTYLIIAVIFITAVLSCGRTALTNTGTKVIIVPETYNSAVTLNSMNKAADVISKRLNNSLAIAPENIKLEVTDKQITLTIFKDGTSETAAIKEVITGYSRLEFRETFENSEITGYLIKADNLLKEKKIVAESKNGDLKNPLLSLLKPRLTEQGDPLPSCMIGLAAGKDTAAVNRYLSMDEIKALLPGNLKLMWSMNTYKYDSTNTLYELHALKVTAPGSNATLDGSVITSATVVPGKSDSNLKIGLTMNAEGTAEWAAITRANINRCIAIVLNGKVRSYPRVQNEISGGQTEITGNFTEAEANNLVSSLNAGQLPFRLKIADEMQ